MDIETQYLKFFHKILLTLCGKFCKENFFISRKNLSFELKSNNIMLIISLNGFADFVFLS